MATTFPLERVRHYVLPAVAALIGLGVAIGIATVPSDVLNAAVDRAGFAGVLPAAASPIGTTGRTILALMAGVLIAACGFAPRGKAWLVDRLDAFARTPRVRTVADGDEADAPVIRRADAHPDAPPRRPIRAASDLGDPLPIFGEEDHRSAPLPPPAEQPIPADLDRPLADFDPAAVPLRPMAPPEPVAPLVRRAEPIEQPVPPAPRFAWLAPEEETVAWVEHVDEPLHAAPMAREERVPDDEPPLVEADPVNDAPVSEARSATSAPGSAFGREEQVAVPVRAPEPVVAAEVPNRQAPTTPRLVMPTPEVHAADPTPTDDESIAGLLARLERGAAQRRIVATPVAEPAPAPASAPAPMPPLTGEAAPASLDDTLQRLRRLAAG